MNQTIQYCYVCKSKYKNEHLNVGPCCACGLEDPTISNIILLKKKTIVPGTGWGCVVCKLPPDGAMTVLCDRCLDDDRAEPKFAILGYAKDKDRCDIDRLIEPFDHDKALHKAEAMNWPPIGGDLPLICDDLEEEEDF